MLIRRLFVVALLMSGRAVTLSAQLDSLHTSAQSRRRSGFVTKRDARTLAWLLGGAMIAYPFDGTVARASQSASLQRSGVLGGVADGFRTLGGPGTVVVTAGLFAVGTICGCRGAADAGLHSMEGLAITSGVTQVLKLGFGRARPAFSNGLDQNEAGPDPDVFRPLRGTGGYTAFPSGHTSAAFAVAAALSAELPHAPSWVGPSLYGAATLVGLSRIYNNKHWASDVVVGAALGHYLGRKVVELQHRDRRQQQAGGLAPLEIAAGPNGVMLVWSLSFH